ncbi:hypothetical protein BJX76DRAFT_355202 [Aspergillus varians]
MFIDGELQTDTSLYQDVMAEFDAMASQTLKKKQGAVPLKEREFIGGEVVEKEKEEKKEEKEGPGTTTTNPEKSTTNSTTTAEPKSNKSKEENNDNHSEPPSINSLQDENAALRAKIIQLQSDLQDAQDFVFSLQPRHQALTEAEASEEFTALCAAVEEWVDQKLGDALDEQQINPDRHVKDIQILMNLIPPAGRAAFHIADTDMDNIQAAILRYLDDALFSQDFYCPLSQSERNFVTSVERSMRSLHPRRDIRACRHWRIETYTAASDRPGFEEYAANRMWGVTCDIVGALRVFVPTIDPNSLAKSFFEGIMKPAAALARRMHLCFDEYTLEWSAYHDRQLLDTAEIFEKESSTKEKFARYEFVELRSKKTLRERPRGEDGEPVKVRWMFDLRPKLVVRKLRADSWAEGKILVKPKILVRVSEQKKGRGPFRKKSEQQEDPTVLAALEEWLHWERKKAAFFGAF